VSARKAFVTVARHACHEPQQEQAARYMPALAAGGQPRRPRLPALFAGMRVLPENVARGQQNCSESRFHDVNFPL